MTDSTGPFAHLSSLDIDAGDRLRRMVESVVGARFTEGNEIAVLRNGQEIFPAMLDAIEASEKTIELLTFVYWKGAIARRFADALSRKARDGVRVRVILDAVGSIPMDPALVDRMTDAGVEVERFRPLSSWKLWQSDHRTHRKILVCDATVGFTGGVGIAEEWEGDARHPGEWRDTHFRVTGPAVMGLRSTFLTDWRDTGHSIDIGDLAHEPPGRGSSVASVIDGSARIGFSDAERLLEALVAAARERLLIQTPYFTPTEQLLTSLAAARRRGVDIDILLPGPHIDKRVSRVVARAAAERLIPEGVRMWAYQPTMMHVKAVIVDGLMAAVGSPNVNRRSADKDEEVVLAIADPAVVETLEGHFGDDVADSIRIGIDQAEPSLGERALRVLLKPLENEM